MGTDECEEFYFMLHDGSSPALDMDLMDNLYENDMLQDRSSPAASYAPSISDTVSPSASELAAAAAAAEASSAEHSARSTPVPPGSLRDDLAP